MRKTLLAAAAAFVIGGMSVGSLISYAQPAPPPGPPCPAGGPGGGPGGPGMAGPGWQHQGPMALDAPLARGGTGQSPRAPSRWCFTRRTAT